MRYVKPDTKAIRCQSTGATWSVLRSRKFILLKLRHFRVKCGASAESERAHPRSSRILITSENFSSAIKTLRGRHETHKGGANDLKAIQSMVMRIPWVDDCVVSTKWLRYHTRYEVVLHCIRIGGGLYQVTNLAVDE